MGIEVPFLNYEEIKAKANLFLQKYHPESDIPVPIESIVEFDMGMDIFPLPGLQDSFDADGCTAYNISTIYVDQFIFDHRKNRYRFTLAHEVGHLILHNTVLKECPEDSSDKVLEFERSIPEGIHSRMEFQAYTFAGLILVPTGHLEFTILETISKLPPELKLAKNGPEILQFSSKFIGDKFEVSAEVIQKRINNESHLKKLYE